MTAKLLREAASKMREKAQAAVECDPSQEPLRWYGAGELMVEFVEDDEPTWVAAAAMPGEDAEHIAAWHPAVALAVADWLDAEAAAADDMPDFLENCQQSLAVARAYLGRPE